VEDVEEFQSDHLKVEMLDVPTNLHDWTRHLADQSHW
jgi:hypothetical protein